MGCEGILINVRLDIEGPADPSREKPQSQVTGSCTPDRRNRGGMDISVKTIRDEGAVFDSMVVGIVVDENPVFLQFA